MYFESKSNNAQGLFQNVKLNQGDPNYFLKLPIQKDLCTFSLLSVTVTFKLFKLKN